jgi:hypothetical protein
MDDPVLRKWLISLLKKIGRRLDKPPQEMPGAPTPNSKTQNEPHDMPFLVSDKPEIRLHPELSKVE